MEEVIRSDLPDPAQKKRPNWVKWCIPAVCLVLVIAAVLLLLHGSQPKRYFFDKDKYPLIGMWMNDMAIPDPSPDWDDMCSVADQRKDACFIAECTVIGGSYNMVQIDSTHGQVLTPIRIDKIHKFYPGESSVKIREGQTAYVIEPYSYVNNFTTAGKEFYREYKGKDGIVRLSSYNPLVTGKYILYLRSDEDYYKYASAVDYYQYDSVPVAENALFLRLFPNNPGAYQIADAEEVEKNRIEVSSDFWEFWTDVMETYAGYTVVTPTITAP